MQALRQHHLLMVRFPAPERGTLHFPIEVGQIVRINASYIDARTGAKVGDVTLHLTGPQDLHFTASTKELFRGWWYLQEWDRAAREFHCSCFEAKTTGFCTHLEQLSPAVVVA
jgi:hypothetical protein